MKQGTIILLLILLSSCEKQKDSKPDTFEEDVLNEWQLEYRLISDDEDFVLSNCMKQSTLEFFEDGTFHKIIYEKNTDGDCIEVLNTSGSWEYFVAGDLSLSIDGETESMSAHIGDIPVSGNLETFVETSNGEYLRIFNATSSNYIISHYKKKDN